MRSRSLLAGALILTATGFAAIGPASAEDGYGAAMVVEFGTNNDGEIPVSIDLPAPASGNAVTSVVFSWQQSPPTWGGTDIARLSVPTPHCVASAVCHVDTVIPTVRIRNGSNTSISVGASDGETFLGGTSRQVLIDNPKPTVLMTSPGHYTEAWGSIEVTVEASPGEGGADLRGVRFYVNPTGSEDDPYSLDTTAPYTAVVDVDDMAAPGGSGWVWAVAEDMQGNLSVFDNSYDMRSFVTSAPPPEVTWLSPFVSGSPVGGMSTQALLKWSAKIPDDAIDSAGAYVKTVELSIDGEHFATWDYTTVSWYNKAAKPREIEFSTFWDGMTPGQHSGTLVVTTGWGSVTTATTQFVVTDGVVFSAVTSAGQAVHNGFIVTAGTAHPFRVRASGKVPGSALQYWNILDGDSSVADSPRACALAEWWDCPDQVTVRGSWVAPDKPGSYTLVFQAQASGDAAPGQITRTIRVQPSGRLSMSTSPTSPQPGVPVSLTGRLVRTDTSAGVRDVKIALQWRRSGSTQWRTVLTRVSGARGFVSARIVPPSSGDYRWRTNGDPGRIGGCKSALGRIRA